jgi:hypothetical protein
MSLFDVAKHICDLLCDSCGQLLETLKRNGFAFESRRQALTDILQDKEHERLRTILRQRFEFFGEPFQPLLAELTG